MVHVVGHTIFGFQVAKGILRGGTQNIKPPRPHKRQQRLALNFRGLLITSPLGQKSIHK